MFEAFPQVVQAELDRLGEKQGWLAEQLGISHASVSNWLSGKRRPSAQNIEAIARVFKRSTSWLYEQMEMGPATSVDSAPLDEGPDPRHAVRSLTAEELQAALVCNPVCPTCGHKSEAA
jgi:transcriptional regulator with XRE-family HTH domain